MDVSSVTAGLEQRKPHRVPAGEKCAADQPFAVTRRPVTMAVVANVEVLGPVNMVRRKVRHLE
jgi:hypothetical protein